VKSFSVLIIDLFSNMLYFTRNTLNDIITYMTFNENYQQINPYKYLSKFESPTWYLDLKELFSEYFFEYDGRGDRKTKDWLQYRKEIVLMMNELLQENKIFLAKNGADEDEERKEIDTIVIHHTKGEKSFPIEYLNTLGLIRLYVQRFSDKGAEQHGSPIWSNHFWKNRQCFIGYHYVIRDDGTYEHILNDKQIGWHSGDWDYNCRSIAIAFMGDFTEATPSETAINTARKIISRYQDIRVLGHREIYSRAVCPGNMFLGNGWKKNLI